VVGYVLKPLLALGAVEFENADPRIDVCARRTSYLQWTADLGIEERHDLRVLEEDDAVVVVSTHLEPPDTHCFFADAARGVGALLADPRDALLEEWLAAVGEEVPDTSHEDGAAHESDEEGLVHASDSDSSEGSDSDAVVVSDGDGDGVGPIEVSMRENRLADEGRYIVDRDTRVPLGELRVLELRSPVLMVICKKHDRCNFSLSIHSGMHQKWVKAVEWLRAGVPLSHAQHQDAAREIKIGFGVKVRDPKNKTSIHMIRVLTDPRPHRSSIK
jgi:hypothetical protein